MKRLYFKCLFLIVFALIGNAYAQTTVKLDATTDGTTKTGCSFAFYDDGGSGGKYANSQDRTITFCPSTSLQRISVEFEAFDLDESDTLIIYQGNSTNETVVLNDGDIGFTGDFLLGAVITAPPTNVSGCLTFRFKADEAGNSAGWKAKITCEDMCQDVVAALDTVFSRIDSLGEMHTFPLNIEYDSSLVKAKKHDAAGNLIYDTIIGTDTLVYNVIDFYALNMCLGDSLLIINAKPEFPYSEYSIPVTHYLPDGTPYTMDSVVGYKQFPENCVYYWSFGDEEYDTVHGNPTVSHHYPFLQGYNLNLKIVDTTDGHSCSSRNVISARVRVAKNPIKTVASIPDMCSGDKQTIFSGYSANSSIILDTITFSQAAREEYYTRTFIPDGGGSNGGCFDAPVTFTTFSPGATIDDKDEVLDICVSMEHSYIGDLGFWLVCPNGQMVTLKYNTHRNGWFMGEPLDSGPYDNDPKLDSNVNPIGTCWTYCFSNQYTTNGQGVIGSNANHLLTGQLYNYTQIAYGNTIDSTHIADSTYYFQTPTQGITGDTHYNDACDVVDLNGFEALIGCELNGEWRLRVCDDFPIDNGWVCSWWMDLGKNSATDWQYQVPLDTVIWEGPYISSLGYNIGLIAPPVDAEGQVTYNISIVDVFGCPWDTVTHMNIVRTPVVDLGPDTSLCEGQTMTLDAGNDGAHAYDWEPTGENTKTIVVDLAENVNGNQEYIVQVTNYNGTLFCYGLDTINIFIDSAALASFTSDLDYMEGCEPLQLQLRGTSENATSYYWVVGDQISTDPNPYFEFTSGTYDLMLAVETSKGCKDTIRYNNIINVFKNPVADFGWDPALPYASNPSVHMVNLTTPDISSNRYHWQYQTNKNDVTSVENVFGFDPTYTWHPQTGQSVAGEYNVLLDAYTYNISPSGRIYECHDTISKLITIINDNIMFPTVITPNGDGINDVFAIHNLIDGQAFPDNELAIYNRYGKRIYFVQDLRNAEDFWDPDKTNSPTGTYFYRFIGRGPIRNVEFKGSVEVLRDK